MYTNKTEIEPAAPEEPGNTHNGISAYRDQAALRAEFQRQMNEGDRWKRVDALTAQYFSGLYDEAPHKAQEQASTLLTRLDAVNSRYAIANVEGGVVVVDLHSIIPTVGGIQNAVVLDATVQRSFPLILAAPSFERLYGNLKVTTHRQKPGTTTLPKVWMEWTERKQYTEGLLFAPGKSQEDVGPGRLNLFTGWGTEPEPFNEQEDRKACAKFLDYLQCVVCDGDPKIYEWVLWWLADIVQNPMTKPGTALVLAGQKGCGKSTLAAFMREIVGQKYFVEASKKNEMVGNFNGHFATALIINGEETTFGGDNAANDTLKAMVTSGFTLINEKNLKAYTARSYCRMIFTTNSHYSHNTSTDERRYLFLDVPSTHVGDREYWDALHAEWDHGGGRQAFANILHGMKKPEGINLRQAPKTAAHTRLLAESLIGEERYFFNALVDGEEYPAEAVENGAIVTSRGVTEAFHTYLDLNGLQKSRKKTDNGFVRSMMEKYWYAEYMDRKVIQGRRETVFKVPSLQDAKLCAIMPVNSGGLGLSREDVGLDEEED